MGQPGQGKKGEAKLKHTCRFKVGTNPKQEEHLSYTKQIIAYINFHPI